MTSLRLIVDTAALAHNWRAYAAASGAAACGAAVKADGYGLGGREVAAAFVAAGCRDLFVATWAEAAALGPLPQGVRVAVLHGVLPGEMATALASPAVPVLNTPAQVAAWRETGRPCDVMVDTGMNRLGLTPAEAVSGLLEGLAIDVLHSHLACADHAPHPSNPRQLAAFAGVAGQVRARRRALCNSAGVMLGPAYHFDLTRPGLGLYGASWTTGARPPGLAPVAGLAAAVVQVRTVAAGTAIGYGATFTASRPTRLAVAAIGYADGYPRGLSAPGSAEAGCHPEEQQPDVGRGFARVDGVACPVVGRVSMDLTAFDVTDAPVPPAEGGLIDIDFDIGRTALAAARSPYELLTGLGRRYARVYR